MILPRSGSRLLKRGIPYLLSDDFTTARDAGAVNGTAAEPGPGTRTLSDAGSLVSIVLDELRIANGGNSTTPHLAFGPYTRRAGLCVMYQVRQNQSGAAAMFTHLGFDADGGARIEANRVQFDSSGNINVANASFFGTYVDVGNYTSQTTYTVAILILNTMAAYCILGGAWTEWTLLGTQSLHASATVYACLNAYNRAVACKSMRLAYLPLTADAEVAGDVLSTAAVRALTAMQPPQPHTTASVNALFDAAAGSGAGIVRAGDDYWLWHGLAGGNRWYVKLEWHAAPSTIHSLDTSEIRDSGGDVLVTLDADGSVWEYAIPVGAIPFVGNAHGYDYEDTLAITVDGAPVVLADTESANGAVVVVTRSSSLRDGVTDLGATVTTYTMSRDGLALDVAITWEGAAPASGNQTMMPFSDTGGDVGFLVTPNSNHQDLTLYVDTNLGYGPETCDCAVGFLRNGAAAVMMQTDAARSVFFQDRGTLNKVYSQGTDTETFGATYRAGLIAASALLR